MYMQVYAVHWAGDSTHLVSASQDGKLIVWNGSTTWKVQSIGLKSPWVMTCGYEQTGDRLVASGGLDNICSIYQLGESSQTSVRRANKELQGHDGYISCCRFVNDRTILTSSGDATCNYWDIDRSVPTVRFIGHAADVMSLAENPENKSIFASVSCDQSLKLWDIRTGHCTNTFKGHESDVNSVAYFPGGNTIGTGSDDSTCRIFDIRCYNEVAVMGNERVTSGITSIQFSKSGDNFISSYYHYFQFIFGELSENQVDFYLLVLKTAFVARGT
jgi:guanine nucleotide-binding protein G(I)/G(S)/G(T) subunit beta-1